MAKIKKVSEIDLSPIQAQYDELKTKVKEAEKNLEAFEKSLRAKKLYIKSGEVKEDKEIWAVFWDVDYYSHFDGHSSDAIYDEYRGAAKLSPENEEALKKILLYWDDMSFDEKKLAIVGDSEVKLFPRGCDPWCFTERIGELFSEYDATEMVNNEFAGEYKFDVTPNSLTITCVDRDDDQGRVCNGSTMTFRLSNKDELSKIKNKQKERRG